MVWTPPPLPSDPAARVEYVIDLYKCVPVPLAAAHAPPLTRTAAHPLIPFMAQQPLGPDDLDDLHVLRLPHWRLEHALQDRVGAALLVREALRSPPPPPLPSQLAGAAHARAQQVRVLHCAVRASGGRIARQADASRLATFAALLTGCVLSTYGGVSDVVGNVLFKVRSAAMSCLLC